MSVGWSSLKNDPFCIDDHRFSTDPNPCSVHAEVHALRQMNFEAKGCVLYVARILKGSGKPALARPCANCMEVIEGSGIKRVVYTIDEKETGEYKP